MTEEFKSYRQSQQTGYANRQVPAKEKDDIHLESLFKTRPDILNYPAYYKGSALPYQSGEEIWVIG